MDKVTVTEEEIDNLNEKMDSVEATVKFIGFMVQGGFYEPRTNNAREALKLWTRQNDGPHLDGCESILYRDAEREVLVGEHGDRPKPLSGKDVFEFIEQEVEKTIAEYGEIY